MKNSLKHMFEISGGISLCALIGAITSNIAISNHWQGYGYMFFHGLLWLSLIVFAVSLFGVLLLNINWAKTGLAKRLANDNGD